MLGRQLQAAIERGTADLASANERLHAMRRVPTPQMLEAEELQTELQATFDLYHQKCAYGPACCCHLGQCRDCTPG